MIITIDNHYGALSQGLDLYGGAQHNHLSRIFASDISASALQVGSTEPCPACPTCGVQHNGSAMPGGFCPTSTDSPLLELNNTIEDSEPHEIIAASEFAF